MIKEKEQYEQKINDKENEIIKIEKNIDNKKKELEKKSQENKKLTEQYENKRI